MGRVRLNGEGEGTGYWVLGIGYGVGDDFWYPSMRSPPHTRYPIPNTLYPSPSPFHQTTLIHPDKLTRNLGLAPCAFGCRWVHNRSPC